MDAQLRQEVRFLTTRLGLMIREQAGPRVFNMVERVRQLSKQADRKSTRLNSSHRL